MKLMLDEMWSPTIAIELRRRGFDVIAANETIHASRYSGIADDRVFALAQVDCRTIVTDNVSDYERARRDWESRGKAHHGVNYALNPPFNRHRGNSVIGDIVRALQQFLLSCEQKNRSIARTTCARLRTTDPTCITRWPSSVRHPVVPRPCRVVPISRSGRRCAPRDSEQSGPPEFKLA